MQCVGKCGFPFYLFSKYIMKEMKNRENGVVSQRFCQ